jgi:thiosulfate reductase cytochrome b subunit
MRIGDIAAGRAGDKGDVLDLTLVARHADDFERLARVVTAEFAARTLNRVVPGAVVRYELPALRALKFVAPAALPGGVHASLRAGLHWQKAAIWLLLDCVLDQSKH